MMALQAMKDGQNQMKALQAMKDTEMALQSRAAQEAVVPIRSSGKYRGGRLLKCS